MERLPAIVARSDAQVWRELLERLLDEPEVAAPRPMRHALAVIDRLERADPRDPALLELLDQAMHALDDARSAATDHVAHTLDAVTAAMRRAREAGLDAVSHGPLSRSIPPPAREFMASSGGPRLHRVTRDARAAEQRPAPEDVDLDEAWAELERTLDDPEPAAEAPPAIAPLPEPSVIQTELGAVARDAMENIGSFGLLRSARGSARRDATTAQFERRLCAAIDALASFGRADEGAAIDVVAALEQYAAAAAVVDPIRAFAHVMALGCLDGADTVRAAVSALRRAHRDERAAMADAFMLAPHPQIGPAMVRLADDADSALAALALDVLRFRGESDFTTSVVCTAHPAAAVRAAAARSLADPRTRDAAVEVLEPLLEEERDPEVAVAVAETLVTLDARAGLDFVRRRLAEEPGPASHAMLGLIAVGGSRPDAALIAAHADYHPAWAAAVGWFGFAQLGDAVAERLYGCTDRAFIEAAAAALVRIAGALPGIEIDDALERTWIDPARVASAWAERRRDLTDGRRLRFGQPFSIEACLVELEQDGARGADRDRAALELAIVTACRVRIEPHDWVARQREGIAAARELLEDPAMRALHRSGEWPAERLGKRLKVQ